MLGAVVDFIRQLRAQHRTSTPTPDSDLYRDARDAIEYGRSSIARADRVTRRIERGDDFSADWARGLGWDGSDRRRNGKEGPS